MAWFSFLLLLVKYERKVIIQEGTVKEKKGQNTIIWGDFLVSPDCRRCYN